jgi:hypothetical protein
MAFLGRESERDQARADAWTAWVARQHPFALASVALSAFSLLHLGSIWVDELAGIVLGAMALARIRHARAGTIQGKTDGRPLAWAGIVVGVASLVIASVVYFVLPPHR